MGLEFVLAAWVALVFEPLDALLELLDELLPHPATASTPQSPAVAVNNLNRIIVSPSHETWTPGPGPGKTRRRLPPLRLVANLLVD